MVDVLTFFHDGGILDAVDMRKVGPPKACSYGGEPGRLPGWSSLPRPHLIPNSNAKFDFCSYEQAGWPA